MLTDSSVVDTDVVVTQSEPGDEADRWQLHLCCNTHEVCRVDASLPTFLGVITIANFAQSLGAE